AGLREADNAIAGPDENVETQLRFELLNLAADAGLRRVQGFGGSGQVIAVANNFNDIAKLLQLHGIPAMQILSSHNGQYATFAYCWPYDKHDGIRLVWSAAFSRRRDRPESRATVQPRSSSLP